VEDLALKLELEGKARLAAKSARALRGGGMFLRTNGGTSIAARPLDDERVTSVDALICWDSRDLQVGTWVLDRHDSYLYSPVSQSMVEAGFGNTIHASHAVVFPGLDTPLRDRVERWNGWYKPVLQHVVERLRDFMQSHQSAIAMLQDGSQGVLSLPNLSQTISTVGRSVLETRLSLIQMYRWIGRIMPIDAGGGATPPEKFEWVERSFNGIADLLTTQMPLVAQALGMPMTRLWGDFSTAGLNNAGAGAERNWLLSVDAYRKARIQPPIERVVRLLAKQAGASDWQKWGIEWPELEVLSSTERATLEKTEAEVDDLRIGQGFPPEVLLKHRFGQGSYTHSPPLLTEEDLDDMEAAVEAKEIQAEEMKARFANAAENPAPEEGEEGEEGGKPEKGVTPKALAPFAEKTKAAAEGEEPDDDEEDDEE
jgi:phage-related protein (TIGR01555 family)